MLMLMMMLESLAKITIVLWNVHFFVNSRMTSFLYRCFCHQEKMNGFIYDY